jgi:hypothetical protein
LTEASPSATDCGRHVDTNEQIRRALRQMDGALNPSYIESS